MKRESDSDKQGETRENTVSRERETERDKPDINRIRQKSRSNEAKPTVESVTSAAQLLSQNIEVYKCYQHLNLLNH